MSDATIRASIKSLMDTVAGIGVVHDYSRWTADEQALRLLFQKDAASPLHGWEITRDGIPALSRIAGDKYEATQGYMIRGHYAIRDSAASEKLFNLVVDAVVQKFIDNRLANTEGHSLPVVSIKEWMFGGVLCHRAEIRLGVAEIVTATPEADQDLINIMLDAYLKPDDETIHSADITI